MKERPILFSGEMIRAILDDRKSMTRRVVTPQPEWWEALHPVGKYRDVGWRWKGWEVSTLDDDYAFRKILVDNGPYCVGQELWVRETWRPGGYDPSGDWGLYQILYRADGACRSMPFDPGHDREPKPNGRKWRPSIFMPKWACRLRCRVTDVRVERAQEISEADAKAEGVPDLQDQPFDNSRWCPKCQGQGVHGAFGTDYGVTEVDCDSCDTAIKLCRNLWDSINAKPKPIYHDGEIVSYVSYPWEDIQETREYRGKPWLIVGNPWVWCISFERIEKP